MAAVMLSAACTTVKNVPEGSCRLTANVVDIIEEDTAVPLDPSEVTNYILQKPNSYVIKGKKGGWNPFLYIYNWDNGRGKGWDNFVHKIGHAPVILDEELINKSETNILTHLEFLGYYGSHVTDSVISTAPRKAYVKYSVFPGKRYPISSIEYKIEDSELEKIYTADSASFLLKKGVFLSEEQLDRESARAASYLKNHGYWEFTKNYFFFEADTAVVKDSAALTVFIHNYTRHENPKDAKPHRKFYFSDVKIIPISDEMKYRASLNMKIPLTFDTVSREGISILYSGKRTTRPDVLYDMNRIRPGDLFSEDIVNNTYDRYTHMRSFSTVSMELDKSDTDKVDCSVTLLPAKINGYKLQLEASVNSTGLFGIAPVISYSNRNIFHGGEWLQVAANGNFQFRFKDPVNAIEFGASAGLSFPTFVFFPDSLFSLVPRTDVNVNFNYQRRPDYTRKRFGADFGYSWSRGDERWSYKLHPVQANIIHMSDVSDSLYSKFQGNRLLYEQYKSNFELGSGFSCTYMSVPSLNPSVSNFKATFAVDMAGNLLSAFNGCMPRDTAGAHAIFGTPYSQFVRAEASAAYTWRFGKDNRHAFAVRAIGGYGFAYGNSEVMPYERQFWVGGANSMRGWNARELGPGAMPRYDVTSIPSQTGNIRLEMNAEYRFPLFWKLYGATFLDCGNVWSSKVSDNDVHKSLEKLAALTLDTFLERLALNTGFGLRLDFNFVVVRFDLGIKLYDPMYDPDYDTIDNPIFNPDSYGWRSINKWFDSKGFALQFSIGYPF